MPIHSEQESKAKTFFGVAFLSLIFFHLFFVSLIYLFAFAQCRRVQNVAISVFPEWNRNSLSFAVGHLIDQPYRHELASI